MKRSVYISFVVLVAIIIAIVFWLKNNKPKDFANSPLDAEYNIDGKLVKLKNGTAETQAAPGSATKVVTSYFGNEVRKDFDGDGREDSVLLLTQNKGRSGTFYYVVAALSTSNGYVGGKAFLLGDRITPQTTEINKDGNIVVNYADRAPGEDFSVAPSVGKSLWLKLDPITLEFTEVLQNFEGEVDPSTMNLGMKTWDWLYTNSNDGSSTTPAKAKTFTLLFLNDGKFSAKTDCNSLGGKYTVRGLKIYFSQMVSTQIFCANSQESVFIDMLNHVQNYLFTPRGELFLNFANGGGMVFK